VAKSLINAPKLLLLDEPTSALDPMGREEVLDTLRSLRGRTTVFFSTHILADARDISESSISSIAAATAACRRA
jgi:ABC-2 type transport system ATP-binding protein